MQNVFLAAFQRITDAIPAIRENDLMQTFKEHHSMQASKGAFSSCIEQPPGWGGVPQGELVADQS